ncbi:MAG: hypothetical protein QG622_1391 [Actinomycetota bacterium]|nr:hypothetical protein [Actinomycetota bacterium]
MTRTRRIILFIVIAFALYAVVTSPQQAAGYVEDAFGLLADAVRGVFAFFDNLLS